MNLNNLSAGLINWHKSLLFILVASLGLTLCGCSSTDSPVERFIFTAETNSVPVATNWTTTVTSTNALGTVETRNIVTWATNSETTVTYNISTNAAAITATAGRVTDIFVPGVGELVSIGLGGLLALWARFRSKKTGAVLVQSVETLLAILETTKGKEFTDGLKLRLAKDQNSAGVLREIANLVNTTVDNAQAKMVAKVILQSIPQSPTTP